ncbi:hypothetical protein GCM10028808_40300 [Spirosoma migulaei]
MFVLSALKAFDRLSDLMKKPSLESRLLDPDSTLIVVKVNPEYYLEFTCQETEGLITSIIIQRMYCINTN